MRNNTNSYSKQATAQDVLGQRNGSSMGSQPENKKKIVKASRLVRANNLFELDPNYGRVTSGLIASKIIQKELVMLIGGRWKEAGISTIQNIIYKWNKDGHIPSIYATKTMIEGNNMINSGALMVNPDVIRQRLLNLDNWDYKNNLEYWSTHKVVKGRKKRYTSKSNPKTKMGFFARLKFLFFPK
jgi:hypothetical protein